MARRVDLSAPELSTDAVVGFIEAHTKDRPRENILFIVTEEALRSFGRRQASDSIPMSDDETKQLNEFLGREWAPDDYLMDTRIPCSSCERVLTFYDVFQTARREQHSDAFLKKVLASDEFSLQVAGRDESFEIQCTQCGTLNAVRLAAKHTYHGKQYCYA